MASVSVTPPPILTASRSVSMTQGGYLNSQLSAALNNEKIKPQRGKYLKVPGLSSKYWVIYDANRHVIV